MQLRFKPFKCAQAALSSKGVGQQGQGVSEDDESSAYEDRHWRLICLHPIGQGWLDRVEAVVNTVTLHGHVAGKLQSKQHALSELDTVTDWQGNAGLYNAPE